MWTKRYTYDAANRQTGIELTGLSETTPGCFRQISRYDGEGLRYETEENGKTIRFLYDRGELAEEAGEDSRTNSFNQCSVEDKDIPVIDISGDCEWDGDEQVTIKAKDNRLVYVGPFSYTNIWNEEAIMAHELYNYAMPESDK